jgi:hypothetical protein
MVGVGIIVEPMREEALNVAVVGAFDEPETQ